MSATTIKRTAANKKAGLSIEDLIKFTTECANAGIPIDTHPTVMQSFRGKLQSIEATA